MRTYLYSTLIIASLAMSALALSNATLRQDTSKGEYLEIKTEAEVPKAIVQKTGTWKSKQAYSDQAYKVGLHVKSGKPITLATRISSSGHHDSQIIGAHGQGTEVRYVGKWIGDNGGAFPNLVLSDQAKFIIDPRAEIDFVMADSFYTRQLWAYGDGTGLLEIEEGFVADRTKGGTVPNAFGTVRLNGVNLLTHHSQSLPYNTRPDGRGGVYHNGHIVWEGQPGSVWTVKTNPHIYRAQLDFDIDGVIDCQVPLVHAGQRRVTSPKMYGGIFQSTGAFRTRKENVTITKRGPAMLALEGQQGYYPGAVLKIEEGMLRMLSNPGNGHRYNDEAGAYLNLIVEKNAGALLSTELAELEKIHIKSGAWLETFDDTRLVVSKGIQVDEGARFQATGILDADATVAGTLAINPRWSLKVNGAFITTGNLVINYDWMFFRKKPSEVVLIEARDWDGTFSNLANGDKISLAGGQVTGELVFAEGVLKIVNLEYHKKNKKKKK